jgi:Protein of unknown function (DUF3024)
MTRRFVRLPLSADRDGPAGTGRQTSTVLVRRAGAEDARHQVRVECQLAPRYLMIVERRAPWRADFGPKWTTFPIARLRYTAADKAWTLYWRDRNLRFHIYDRLAPSRIIDDVLLEIDRDPTGIFWG